MSARTVDAASLKIAWDPPTEGIPAGYFVLVGTASLSYSQVFDAGLTTTYEITGLQEGVTYYIAVQTYDGHGRLSVLSNEVSGMPRSGGSGNAPVVSVTSPFDGATYTAPATISLAAAASDPDGSVARVEFFANNQSLGSDTAPPFALSWPGVGAGTYTITAVATDDQGNSTRSAGVNIAVSSTTGGAGTSATFVGSDILTSGSWIGVYGREGYALAADAMSVPAYAQLAVVGAAQWTWAAATGDLRALQTASGAGRVAAAAYGERFSIDINLTDDRSHRVGLYAVDWDSRARVQRIDIFDAASNALLDSRTMDNFWGGQYVIWTLRGHVRLEVTRLGGANAVVSGLFFDPTTTGVTSPTTAAFVAMDKTTQGNWRGMYGASGYGIAGDVVTLPAYAQLAVRDAAVWTWAALTADVRALQRADGTGRVAAAAYGAAFEIDLHLTDGRSHRVALYSVDWENAGRSQQIDILDAETGALLDSHTISSYSAGVYLVWDISGHVVIRVKNTGWPNAVVSGLFID